MSLEEDSRAARAMGLSYGKYKALTYNPDQKAPANIPPKKNPHQKPKRWKDEDAFAMWQEGKSDSEIGQALGVSRTIIQRWRDVIELPSNKKGQIDTKKYRLERTSDGIYYVFHEKTSKT